MDDDWYRANCERILRKAAHHEIAGIILAKERDKWMTIARWLAEEVFSYDKATHAPVYESVEEVLQSMEEDFGDIELSGYASIEDMVKNGMHRMMLK